MDKIKDVVKEVIQKISSKKPEEQIQLQDIWKKCAGESGIRHASIGGFRDGVLTVYVDSPAWMFQMNSKKKSFLKEIQAAHPDVKQIIFKIGKV